jgi:hypothetical protein
MTPPVALLAPLLPLLAALGLWFAPAKLAGWLALAAAAATLGLALALPWTAVAGPWLRADLPAIHLAVTLALAALAAAWFARPTATGRSAAPPLAALGLLLLATLAGNPLLAWTGLAGGLLAMLPADPRAWRGPAAWRALLLLLAGLALALAGTVLLARAAIVPDAFALSLAIVPLTAGFAIAAGLAPAQAWLVPAWRTQGAMLPALAVPVALLLLLRLVPLAAARPEALQPGPALLALGLLSVLSAAAWLATDRRRDPAAPILLLYSGLASFAFGLGAPAEGLVLITAAAILLPAWRRAQPHPRLRALLLAALALMPPTAGFGAALGLLAATIRIQPWLALPLGLALAVALGALARRLPALWHAGPAAPRGADSLAAALLLALAVAAGLLPATAPWLEAVAGALR